MVTFFWTQKIDVFHIVILIMNVFFFVQFIQSLFFYFDCFFKCFSYFKLNNRHFLTLYSWIFSYQNIQKLKLNRLLIDTTFWIYIVFNSTKISVFSDRNYFFS